jgi:uncharacterized membrane protein YkoI
MPFRAVAVLALAGVLSGPALASAQDNCLNREQRHAAVASKQVIPLAAALRAAHGRRSELVDAHLCKGPDGLFYVLTLLPRDGKVRRAAVNAATGKLAEAR